MRKPLTIAAAVIAALAQLGCGGPAAPADPPGDPAPAADGWKTFRSEQFDVQFDVPRGWTADAAAAGDRPRLVASSPDEGVRLYVYSFRGGGATTEEALDRAAAELGFAVTGQKHHETINGLDAWVAEAEGSSEGAPVGLFIAALRGGDNTHVAYIATGRARFDANAEVMNKILDSFRKLE